MGVNKSYLRRILKTKWNQSKHREKFEVLCKCLDLNFYEAFPFLAECENYDIEKTLLPILERAKTNKSII